MQTRPASTQPCTCKAVWIARMVAAWYIRLRHFSAKKLSPVRPMERPHISAWPGHPANGYTQRMPAAFPNHLCSLLPLRYTDHAYDPPSIYISELTAVVDPTRHHHCQITNLAFVIIRCTLISNPNSIPASNSLVNRFEISQCTMPLSHWPLFSPAQCDSINENIAKPSAITSTLPVTSCARLHERQNDRARQEMPVNKNNHAEQTHAHELYNTRSDQQICTKTAWNSLTERHPPQIHVCTNIWKENIPLIPASTVKIMSTTPRHNRSADPNAHAYMICGARAPMVEMPQMPSLWLEDRSSQQASHNVRNKSGCNLWLACTRWNACWTAFVWEIHVHLSIRPLHARVFTVRALVGAIIPTALLHFKKEDHWCFSFSFFLFCCLFWLISITFPSRERCFTIFTPGLITICMRSGCLLGKIQFHFHILRSFICIDIYDCPCLFISLIMASVFNFLRTL